MFDYQSSIYQHTPQNHISLILKRNDK